jgi:hypothetical protein
MLPLIKGRTVFVGAAIAGETLKVESANTHIDTIFRVRNLKKLFIAKSFH